MPAPKKKTAKGGETGDDGSVTDFSEFVDQITTAIRGAGGGGNGAEASRAVDERLLRDNFRYRERHRLDQTRIDELEEAVPGDGAIVIPADKAKALGITKLEDVETMHTDLGKLRNETTTHARTGTFQAAAKELGWQPAVLQNLPGMAEHRVELRDETVITDGKSAVKKVPYIIPPGEGAAAEKLEDYVGRKPEWSPFQPALKATSEEGGDQQQRQPDGTPFPKQKAKGGEPPPKGDAADAHIARMKQRAEAPNPLRKAKAAPTT